MRIHQAYRTHPLSMYGALVACCTPVLFQVIVILGAGIVDVGSVLIYAGVPLTAFVLIALRWPSIAVGIAAVGGMLWLLMAASSVLIAVADMSSNGTMEALDWIWVGVALLLGVMPFVGAIVMDRARRQSERGTRLVADRSAQSSGA